MAGRESESAEIVQTPDGEKHELVVGSRWRRGDDVLVFKDCPTDGPLFDIEDAEYPFAESQYESAEFMHAVLEGDIVPIEDDEE